MKTGEVRDMPVRGAKVRPLSVEAYRALGEVGWIPKGNEQPRRKLTAVLVALLVLTGRSASSANAPGTSLGGGDVARTGQAKAPRDSSKSSTPRGQLQRDSRLEDLIAGLESEDINTWSRATTFLGMRGENARPAVPALIGALNRSNVRYSALNALKQLGPVAEEAIPALIKTVTAYPQDPSSRWVAAQALASIGTAAVPALQEAAQSKDAVLKVWACAALVKSEGTNSPGLRYLAATIQTKDRIAPEALRAIKMLGPLAAPIVAQLREAMKDATLPEKDFVEALANIGKDAESAMPEVLKALETKDHWGRIEAIRAVKAINGPSAVAAVPLLIKALEANEPLDASKSIQQRVLREEATETLGRIGPDAKPGLPVLLKALDDPQERVRANAVTAIKRIDPTNSQALPALINAMRDPSIRVQYAANAALLKAGPVNIEVIRAFIHAVRENADLFRADGGYRGPSYHIVPTSEGFFDRLGPEHLYAVADLAEMAKDPRRGVQRMAFTGLTRIGEIPEEFAPVLVKQMPDCYWAQSALSNMGPKAKAAVPELVAMLEDSRKRRAAADVLAAIGRPAADPAIPVFERCISEAPSPPTDLCQALLKLDVSSKVALDGFEEFVAMPQRGQLGTFGLLDAHARLFQSGRNPQVHLDYLTNQLQNPDERISAWAVKAILGCNAQNRARTDALDRVFLLFETGKDEWAVGVAAQGLACLGPKDRACVPQLIRALSDLPRGERDQAVALAIAALGQIGPDAREALPRLKALLEYQPQGAPMPEELRKSLAISEEWRESLDYAARTVRKAAQAAIRRIEQPDP